jgi:hypothetical protein
MQAGKMLYEGPFSPFTLEHYRKMIRLLLLRGDVEFITYDHLAWEEADDHTLGYPREWERWTGRPKSGTCQVLIQHDADSGPYQTQEMLALEAELGIISTTMVFNEWQVGRIGVDDVVPYPIDWDFLKSLEKLGFVFGYHTNAVHNANFDRLGAIRLFEKDVTALNERLLIKYFSPHGGLVLNGMGNASVDFQTETRCALRHVHNRFSPKFVSTFTDGGLIGRTASGDHRLDFCQWTKTLRQNQRYRMLIHPQYYSDSRFRAPSAETLLRIDCM